MTVPGLRYERVDPRKWPQDHGAIPNGFGGMPAVDFDNRFNVRQEAFIYGIQTMTVAIGAIETRTIQIQPDADFWCNQIVFDATNGLSVAAPVKIKDLRTAYELTYPFAYLQDFLNSRRLGSDIPRLPAVLPKPYCFTRNGGIEVTIDNTRSTNEQIVAKIGFIGWKEFANVSR